MQNTNLITLLAAVSMENHYGRGILTGIRHATHDDPRIRLKTLNINTVDLPRLEQQFAKEELQGIIASAYTQPIVRSLQASGLPVINVSARNVNPLPFVGVDNVAVGANAARYLLSLGMKHFLYIKVGARFANHREQGFRDLLQEAGASAETMHGGSGRQKEVLEYVLSAPKPLGVFCCFDRLARDLVDRLIDTQLKVPEDVSVLSVDDTEHICEGGSISLSSIPTSSEQSGYQAVSALVDLIRGKDREFPLLLPPGKVTERDSTRYNHIRNPGLARAVRYLQRHACTGISVEDVVQASGLSRASLDRHLPEILGCSPAQEIRRIQLEHAEHLLKNSTRDIADIAAMSGFSSAAYFIKIFREQHGVTPLKFRRQQL